MVKTLRLKISSNARNEWIKNLALVRINEWTWVLISSQHVPFDDSWLVGMISTGSDPSVMNSSSQHQDKGTLSAQLVNSSCPAWIVFELCLCYSRKTSDKGLRPGLSSLSLLDMDKSPSSVSFSPTVTLAAQFFLPVSQGLVCAHIPVSLSPTLFFPSRKWCQYPARTANRCSDHHYWWCKGGWQMRLFCSDSSSLCTVYRRNVLR